MIRLLRSVFILTLVLIAGLVAIIGLTYRNTNRFAYLFTDPNGMPCTVPCLLGADPATMTFEQADKVLNASPILKSGEHYSETAFAYQSYKHDQIGVILSETRYLVTIRVSFGSEPITLGELLMMWGKPERIVLSRIPLGNDTFCGYLAFLMQGRAVTISLHRNPKGCMNPSQRISEFTLSPSRPEQAKHYVLWSGFNSAEFYETQLKQLEQAN